MFARAGWVCNNMAMNAPNDSRVTLDLLARASALSTGDARASRWVMARVASAHPRPERERESTLVSRYIESLDAWRERDRTRPETPEPIAGISDAVGSLSGTHEPRALDLAILQHALGVDLAVIHNAMAASDEETPVAGLTGDKIDRLREAAMAVDTAPLLEGAAREIERASARRRRFAYAQAIAFLFVVGLLVYVKIDLKKAADEERANAVPSLERGR